MAPRVATLYDKNSNDINEEDFYKKQSIQQRLQRISPPKSGDYTVFWEYQEKDRMCALHCINSLLQGPIFNEADLSKVALCLDQAERNLLSAETLHNSPNNQELKALLAGGSINASDDGFFSLPVLEECLKLHNISCTGLTKSSMKAILLNELAEEAFMCNFHEHWIAVRKVHGQWYNLDSLKPAPTRLGSFYLMAFLENMIDQGYSVFVVRSNFSKLPLPNKNLYEHQPLKRNQLYLTDQQIDDLTRIEHDYHNQVLQSESNAGGGDIKSNTPKSTISCNETNWPSDGGRRLTEVSVSTKKDDISNDVANETLDMDDDLRRALEQSVHDYYAAAPQAPEEPDVNTEDVITFQVRLLDGSKISRRFQHSDIIETLFLWVESRPLPKLQCLEPFSLISQFPHRRFIRDNRQTVMLFKEEVTQDVAKDLIATHFPFKQEQLVMQRN